MEAAYQTIDQLTRDVDKAVKGGLTISSDIFSKIGDAAHSDEVLHGVVSHSKKRRDACRRAFTVYKTMFYGSLISLVGGVAPLITNSLDERQSLISGGISLAGLAGAFLFGSMGEKHEKRGTLYDSIARWTERTPLYHH